MIAEDRYKIILGLLAAKGVVSKSDLSNVLTVSGETLRRDLNYLENKGKLIRVHGGIKSAQKSDIDALSIRVLENLEEKRELCEYAANFIEEEDVIALDTGSTVMVFCEVLKERFKKLTVVTYSMAVFNALKNTFNVILTGGNYFAKEDCLYGHMVTDTLSDIYVSKSFIFPSAISLQHGIEDYVPQIMPLQKKMMEISGKVFILADSRKYLCRAMLKLADLSKDYTFITDSKLDRATKKQFLKLNIKLVCGE